MRALARESTDRPTGRVGRDGFSGRRTGRRSAGRGAREGARSACSAVPIRLRVVQTLTDVDGLVALREKGGEHELGEVVGRLFVDVVGDHEVFVCSGITPDAVGEAVFGALNEGWCDAVVVVCVDVEVGLDAFISISVLLCKPCEPYDVIA